MHTSLVYPQQYNMKVNGLETNILHSMNQERKSNGHTFCEVVLLAAGVKLYAHKIVLISYSDFFRNYFEDQAEEVSLTGKDSTIVSETDSEKSKSEDDIVSLKSDETCDSSENAMQRATCHGNDQTTINLPGINTEELDLILEYMYTSQLVLRAANVNEILLVGCLLQISSVIEFCAEVLLKRPSWRSPLVSPQLLNFVKGRGTAAQMEKPVASSTTAVTWATDGGRPMSHKIRFSRKRGRVIKSDYAHDVGNMLAGPSRQSGGETGGARKRQHPNFSTSNGIDQKQDSVKGRRITSRGRGHDSSKKCSPTIEQQQQEYLVNIDFVELDRELTRNEQLMKSWRYHSAGLSFQQYSPNSSNRCGQPAITPPLINARSVNAIGEGSDSRKYVDDKGLLFSGYGPLIIPQCDSLSSQYDLKNAKTSKRKFSGASQAVAMFPQISYCNRSLAAFGLPMLHPGYFGVPFVNGRMEHSPDFGTTPHPGPPREKYVGNRYVREPFILGQTQRRKYDEKIAPQNRYAPAIAAVNTNPATIQQHESPQFATTQSTNRQTTMYPATQSQIFPEHLNLRTKVGFESSVRKGVRLYSEPPSGISSHAGFKRFARDIVHRRDSLPYDGGNEEETVRQEPTDLSMPFRGRLKDSRNRDISKHQTARDDLVAANSIESSFVLNSRAERKPEAGGTSATFELPVDLKNSVKDHHARYVDYHKRKNKLLRAAPDSQAMKRPKKVKRMTQVDPRI